jgi:hypothetical protein
VNSNGTLYLEKTLGFDIFAKHAVDRECWKVKQPCKTPFSDFVHFTGKTKPWLRSPPEGFETEAKASPQHFWYHILYILNEKMQLGIDFSQWRQYHRPYLGMFPTHGTAAKTVYALTNSASNSSAAATALPS